MALCLFCGSQLVGCGTGDQAVSGTSSSQSSRAVTPVPLSNPSPGQLEVSVNIMIGGYDPPARETTSITLAFASHGHSIQFVGNEQLICNATAIQLHNRIASFQVMEAPTKTLEGRTYSCVYSVSGSSTMLSFTVPQAPAILTPENQAQVRRSAQTLITYEVQEGKLQGIVALGPGPSAKAIARLNTPHSMQATIDSSAFPPGAGSIVLTQLLTPQLDQTGAAFESLSGRGTAMDMIAVIWV